MFEFDAAVLAFCSRFAHKKVPSIVVFLNFFKGLKYGTTRKPYKNSNLFICAPQFAIQRSIVL